MEPLIISTLSAGSNQNGCVQSHTVNLVVHAWDDKRLDVTKTIDEITECLCVLCGPPYTAWLTWTYRFHPDFYDGKSKVQSTMLGYMNEWVEDFGHHKKSVLKRLTKESVRAHKNILREGETGPSQALINPLGLPNIEDLIVKRPPPGVGSSVVGTLEGKPVYFNPETYGKGSDTSPGTRGAGTPPSYASPYSPASPGSEAEDQQPYMWTAGLSREGDGSVSESAEDFYSAEGSGSLSATSNFYSPPSGSSQSTEDYYSAGPDPRRTVTERYAPPQWGPSKAAQDFYNSPGPTPHQFQSPPLGSQQQFSGQISQNPFLRQMGSAQQPQSRGMHFYTQGPQQGLQSSYKPGSPQTPQISPEAASFYAPPPPPPPQFASKFGEEDEADPLAELTANLRKF